MIDESTLFNVWDETFSCVGPLFDVNPQTTHARVRPFLWAYLLLRGAVRRSEVVQALSGHVAHDDKKVGLEDDPFDRSRLEVVIDETLAELVAEGVLRSRNRDDLFVLHKDALAKTVSVTCVLNAQLPEHLVLEQEL